MEVLSGRWVEEVLAGAQWKGQRRGECVVGQIDQVAGTAAEKWVCWQKLVGRRREGTVAVWMRLHHVDAASHGTVTAAAVDVVALLIHVNADCTSH